MRATTEHVTRELLIGKPWCLRFLMCRQFTGVGSKEGVDIAEWEE